LEENSIELCLTDPPYGINYKGIYNHKKEVLYPDQKFSFAWLKEALRVCKGVFFACGLTHLYDWIQYKKPDYTLKIAYLPGTGSYFHTDLFLGYGKIKKITHLRDIFVLNAPRYQGFLHPSPKSLDEWLYILRKLKPKNVLDPFCGSGTTIEACKILGIDCLCYEINKIYKHDIDIRIKRSKREKKQITLFFD